MSMVSLPCGELGWPETADGTYSILASKREFFYHAGEVVRVHQEPGQPAVIKNVSAAEAVSSFARHITFFSGPKRRSLKREDATIILAAAAKTQLPHLKEISHQPVLREVEEQLIATPRGYDPVTQVFYTSESPPDVHFGVAANCIIHELLEEFVFESQADKGRALANFILPALKQAGLVKGRVPIVVLEADVRGTGKGYLDSLRAACYGSQVKLVPMGRGGVGSPDEAFGQSLYHGNPFPQLDNLRGTYDSSLLEQFATCDGLFEVRLVRLGYRSVDCEKYFPSITSNGFDTTEDLADRCLFTRLKHLGQGIAFRQYPEGDILDHVRAYQPFFLGCIFAVIRQWYECGQHRTCENRFRNGFHDGVQVADWIAQSLFGLPPIFRHPDLFRKKE